MPDRSMTGVYPILSTPFRKDSSIHYEDLEREVEWFIESGVHGMGIAMASEVYKLTGPERDDVLKAVVKTANGRAKVVMNTGAEGTDATIFQSKRAEELGADALMIRPPTYVPTVAAEVVEFFGRIGEAVSIPVFLQDQITAQVTPAMAVQCANRHENLCYIKVETPPTVPRTAEAARLRGDSGLILFGGAGGAFFLEELRRGSVGTMPGSTMPDVWVRIWNLWQDGEEQAAEEEFHRHAPLIRTLAQSLGISNTIYKHITARRGVTSMESAYARHPSLEPDELQLYEVDRMLEKQGLV